MSTKIDRDFRPEDTRISERPKKYVTKTTAILIKQKGIRLFKRK